MQQPTHHTVNAQIGSENRMCDCVPRVATRTRPAGVGWPAKNPSELLQFWRLNRRLELQRGHGRLLIHGTSYWK